MEENIKRNKIYFYHKANNLECNGDFHNKNCFGEPYLFLGEYENNLLVTRIIQADSLQYPQKFLEVKLKDFKNFHFYSDNQMAFNKKTYINPALIRRFRKTMLLTENLEKETLETTFDQQKFFELADKRIRQLEEINIKDNEY
jgi:hypothetical protein